MVGERLAAALVSLLVLALLLGLPFGDGAQAHSFKGGYSTVVSPTTAGAVADLTTVFSIGSPYPNYDKIATAGSGNAFYVASDMELPLGSAVGSIAAMTTLSLLNAPCNTPITVNIPFMEATTDIFHTMNWVGDGSNLVLDPNGNGIPNYAEYYPAYLNKILDPDGSGNLYADPYLPIKPRARYVGHAVLMPLVYAAPTQLNFLMLNPGDLQNFTGALGGIGDSRGYINVVILNNPVAPTAPSTQTDFCTGLSTTIVLKGLTQGEWQCIGCIAANEPFETVWPVQQCGNGVDNDSDGVADDGCLKITDPCDGVDNDGDGQTDEGCNLTRGKNPPANTGIYGGNTHLALTYVQSQYDGPAKTPPLPSPEPAAGDGIENQLDTCPFQVNAGNPRVGGSGDTDQDGLDNVCDPTPGTASPGAPGTCQPPEVRGVHDQDQDCYPNRQDNCPLLANNQDDTDGDGIGDACDPNPSTPDGHFHEDNPTSAVCIGDTDTDGDGWCDSTEDLLGSAKSGAGAAGKTPEYYGLVYDAVPGPYVCSDFAVYGHPDSGAVDNDGDTQANANDTVGCTCPTSPVDTDCDGVPDSTDNCDNDDNPDQLNTDAYLQAQGASVTGDALGDACDTDDDNDTVDDSIESYLGTDTKDNCTNALGTTDGNPYDLTLDQSIDVGDILTFQPVMLTAVGTTLNDVRFDLAPDQSIDVGDILMFKPVMLTSCT